MVWTPEDSRRDCRRDSGRVSDQCAGARLGVWSWNSGRRAVNPCFQERDQACLGAGAAGSLAGKYSRAAKARITRVPKLFDGRWRSATISGLAPIWWTVQGLRKRLHRSSFCSVKVVFPSRPALRLCCRAQPLSRAAVAQAPASSPIGRGRLLTGASTAAR